jgi:uncharacterized cupin superfamily protein
VRRVNLNEIPLEAERDRDGYRRREARVGRAIGADLIGATLYDVPDGESIAPYHFHHGVEEWAIVVDGTPTVRTPEGERTLRRGDVVCFAVGPAGAHTVRGPARVLLLSTTREPSLSVYPDSDKLGTKAGEGGADRLMFRRRDAVDYWDGE